MIYSWFSRVFCPFSRTLCSPFSTFLGPFPLIKTRDLAFKRRKSFWPFSPFCPFKVEKAAKKCFVNLLMQPHRRSERKVGGRKWRNESGRNTCYWQCRNRNQNGRWRWGDSGWLSALNDRLPPMMVIVPVVRWRFRVKKGPSVYSSGCGIKCQTVIKVMAPYRLRGSCRLAWLMTSVIITENVIHMLGMRRWSTTGMIALGAKTSSRRNLLQVT